MFTWKCLFAEGYEICKLIFDQLDLETFLEKEERKNCSKCAYVIPTYEISHKAENLPASKAELLSLIKRKHARQFHQTLYPINQKSSNLNKWERIGQTAQMDIAYKVQQYIFKYEPLYIARGDTPPFDERFQGFGLTRNTQVELRNHSVLFSPLNIEGL